MKIAILTRPDCRSPRILAESFQHQLTEAGVQAKVFYNIDILKRLYNCSESKKTIKFHFWLRRKIAHYFGDKKVLQILKRYDAVVISECSPNGFWKNLYNVERLKEIIKIPVLFYEVYYLGNTPTQLQQLQKAKEPTFARYDWHLAVSEVTEIRGTPGMGWSSIGLDLAYTGLKPAPKKEFIALVDFVQEGYEKYHHQQTEVLAELGIKTIVLQGRYSLDQIRELYKSACIFFLQSTEAFGLPVAECLACGVQIFTPDSGWPMSWRLDENPQLHSTGILPEVFTVYHSREDLVHKVATLKNNYDLHKSPFQIFDIFISHYRHFYYGNQTELNGVLKRIEQRNFT